MEAWKAGTLTDDRQGLDLGELGHTDTFVDFGLVPRSASVEVRDLQNQITALLITTIRNLEAEKRELLKARKASTSSLP